MPRGLQRFHHSGHSHFVTFSCYRRQPNFISAAVYDLFPDCLERMRRRFDMRVYGYVVMPEHVHLLLSEPKQGTLAEAIHYLKLSFTKRLHSRLPRGGSFWQKRYYDRKCPRCEGIRTEAELFTPQSTKAWPGKGCGRLEVEQFSTLCFPGERSGRD